MLVAHQAVARKQVMLLPVEVVAIHHEVGQVTPVAHFMREGTHGGVVGLGFEHGPASGRAEAYGDNGILSKGGKAQWIGFGVDPDAVLEELRPAQHRHGLGLG